MSGPDFTVAVKAKVSSVSKGASKTASATLSGPISIQLGISLGGFDHIENQIRRVAKHGPNRLLPSAVEACIHLAAASTIAHLMGIPARIGTLSNSCVGGLDAVAAAAGQIRRGEVDVALAGGSDAAITPSAMAGFCAAGMVTQSCNDHPAEASRPFDRRRDGGVLGEGSAILVLENLEHARVRGAPAYLEILGYGTAADRSDGEPGSGLEGTIAEALANSALRPEQLDYVCAHGPSDPVLDRVETDCLKQALGPHARRIPVSSIKGVTANALAASGAHQVVTCALAMRHGWVPPTANYRTPDPRCDLDYVPRQARRARLEYALIDAHGSGRTNSSLVVGRADRP